MFGTNEAISNETAASVFFQVYRRAHFVALYAMFEEQLRRELYILTSRDARDETLRRFRRGPEAKP